jgi:CheY-like chemotaxis protein
MNPAARSSLSHRRILIVEDEGIVAWALADSIAARGAIVVGPASTVGQALALIASDDSFDAALLDMNLGGIIADPVADRLVACGIPFVFISGYGQGVVADRHAAVPCVSKPFETETIVTLLADSLGSWRG